MYYAIRVEKSGHPHTALASFMTAGKVRPPAFSRAGLHNSGNNPYSLTKETAGKCLGKKKEHEYIIPAETPRLRSHLRINRPLSMPICDAT